MAIMKNQLFYDHEDDNSGSERLEALKQELPDQHIKEVYSKYKCKRFEIVSFSIDRKKAFWDKAYRDDQLPWIDTSDLLAEKSPMAKMYGVLGVPASYLIDKDGNIIGAEMRGDKLDDVLREIFED